MVSPTPAPMAMGSKPPSNTRCAKLGAAEVLRIMAVVPAGYAPLGNETYTIRSAAPTFAEPPLLAGSALRDNAARDAVVTGSHIGCETSADSGSAMRGGGGGGGPVSSHALSAATAAHVARTPTASVRARVRVLIRCSRSRRTPPNKTDAPSPARHEAPVVLAPAPAARRCQRLSPRRSAPYVRRSPNRPPATASPPLALLRHAGTPASVPPNRRRRARR